MSFTQKVFQASDDQGFIYNIELFTSNNILYLRTILVNDMIKIEYTSSNNLENLKQQNKIFLPYDDINEVYDALSDYIETNKILGIICKIIKDISKLNLIIPIKAGKIKEIVFQLFEKNINNDNKNKINNEANKQLDSIYFTLNQFEREKNEMKSMILNLQEKVRKIESYYYFDSLILRMEEIPLVKNWINPNKEVSMELLYRASLYGDDRKIFHQYCDGKGPTIIFIKTTEGRRIGGYTSIPWETPVKKGWALDEDAFIFSLDNKMKFDLIKGQENKAVFHDAIDDDWNFSFGWDIIIYNKCMKSNNSYCKPTNYTGNNMYLLGQDKKEVYFKVSELEAYSVW